LERVARDKRSRLFGLVVGDEEKGFVTEITTEVNIIKLNFYFTDVVHEIRRISIGEVFKSKMAVTASHDSHYCTCLYLLGRCDTYRNDPICIAPPKVAKASIKSVAVVDISVNKICQCTQAYKLHLFLSSKHGLSLKRKTRSGERHLVYTFTPNCWNLIL
jgi:hypothetical protein